MDKGKAVIIINGAGGVGKDTLCQFAAEKYRVKNISSVDQVKEAARNYAGWSDEKKDPKSRKFLSDLKALLVDYCDAPCRYLEAEYRKFLGTDEELLFVHIREIDEIEKFKKRILALGQTPCYTLLIRRGASRHSWGNRSDDEVERYAYDWYYDNDRPLDEAGTDFLHFLQENVMIQGTKGHKSETKRLR